jgi:hypothetical protein
MEVDIDQSVHLLLIIETIDTEHGNIHMGILHPGILPVCELKKLLPHSFWLIE